MGLQKIRINAIQNSGVGHWAVIVWPIMLYCHIINSPDQKAQLIESLGEKDSLYVVNDLESKFWMQNRLLSKENVVVNTDQVIRASELWQKILFLKDPSWKVLSPHFAEYLLETWMAEIIAGDSFRLSSKDCARAYQTMGQILPLLGHFQGEDIMSDWFAENPEASERWSDWYKLCRSLWDRFLQQRVIPLEWMKGVLINEELPSLESQHLFVDLGIDIDDIESELFLNLSRSQDIHIIVPASEDKKEAYDSLIARAQIKKYELELVPKELTFKKLPSMLGEVKEAVFRVRGWLDEGIKAEQIAIVSSQIENYWPTLYEHLLVEGVPVNKDIVTPMSQLPAIQNWLSQIRMASRKIQTGDTEQIVFADNTSPQMDYRAFQSLYFNIYDVSDLDRDVEIKKVLPELRNPDEKLNFSHFLDLAVPLIAKNEWRQVEIFLSELDPIYEMAEKLTFKKWVDFFEKYFSRSEKKISSGDVDGILVLPLRSSPNPMITKAIVLGLSEKNLLENHNTALHWSDIESIKLNFGFNLPHADRKVLEDYLNWFELKNISEKVYTHSETDFSGQFQSPSMFWLQGAMKKQEGLELTSPGETRWDEVIAQGDGQDLLNPGNLLNLRDSFIKRDMGLGHYAKVKFPNLSLSASSFEQYFKCPFKLFAEKGLKLKEDPWLDLDIDHRSRGQLLHRLCEIIVWEKKWSLKDDELLILIDKARDDVSLPIYSEEIWHFLRPYYLKAIKAFISFEMDWRKDHPNTETVAVEEFIKTKIRLEGNEFYFDSTEGIPFRGVIDRVDKNDRGQFAVIDYKSSDNGLTQYSSWLKKGKIQLVLYSLALIEGVVTENREDVVGAFYYVLKKLDRNKGFVLSESSDDFLDPKKMSREDLESLLSETRQLVAKMVNEILEGQIEPAPKLELEKDMCEKCDWNKICRYPALNL